MRYDEILLEKVETLSTDERVYINPSRRQIEKWWSDEDEYPRGLLADDLYVWAGYDSIHREAMRELGLHPSETFGLFLSPSGVIVSSGGEQGEMEEDEIESLVSLLQNDRHLQRIYGQNFDVDAQGDF